MNSSGAPETARPEELTLFQISEKYNGRWVAILVTKRDRNHQPVRGRVVADDIDRYRVREKTTRYDDLCIFYAGDVAYHLLL